MNLPSSEDKQNKSIKKTLSLGSEAIGSVVGAGVGATVGGLPGAIVGSAVVPFITTVLKETGVLALSFADKKGKARTEKALKHCIELINQKLERGEKIRTDDFFNLNLEGSSHFEEMFENVIRSVEQDTQAKKTLIYSHLMTNLLFDEYVDIDEIFFLIGILKKISYLQLKIIKFLVEDDIKNVGCMFDAPYHLGTDMKNVNLSSEIKQLELLGIVKPVTIDAPPSPDDYYSGYLEKVYRLYGLDTIPDFLTTKFLKRLSEI